MLNLRDDCLLWSSKRERLPFIIDGTVHLAHLERIRLYLHPNTPEASPPTPPTESDSEELVPRHHRNGADRKCNSADRRLSGAALSPWMLVIQRKSVVVQPGDLQPWRWTVAIASSMLFCMTLHKALHSFVERLSSQLIRGGWLLNDMQSAPQDNHGNLRGFAQLRRGINRDLCNLRYASTSPRSLRGCSQESPFLMPVSSLETSL